MAIMIFPYKEDLFVAYGLSTDVKPTAPPNNCLFIETNTTNVYIAASGIWTLSIHTKVIKDFADFPTPVAGVILLNDNTDYLINGTVNIGTNTIKVGQNNSILGEDRFKDVLIGTTTGNMIEIGSATPPYAALLCRTVNLQCPNGTLFNATNQGMTLDFCLISNTKNVGVFTSVSNLVSVFILTTNVSNCTGTGIVINGTLGVNFRFF